MLGFSLDFHATALSWLIHVSSCEPVQGSFFTRFGSLLMGAASTISRRGDTLVLGPIADRTMRFRPCRTVYLLSLLHTSRIKSQQCEMLQDGAVQALQNSIMTSRAAFVASPFMYYTVCILSCSSSFSLRSFTCHACLTRLKTLGTVITDRFRLCRAVTLRRKWV